MSQRTATIESLPMAFEVVKAIRADGLEWGEGYRPLGRQALAEIIQGRMAEAVDDWLDSLDGSAMRDRRNGSYWRHLLTELGDIESARDADGNPHAWYDPNVPVTISFVTIGGDTEKVEGYLPLHHAVLVGKDEFRFTITEGTRSFASVTAQRCDYP